MRAQGTYQAAEDDCEEIEVDSSIRKAPQDKSCDTASNSTDGHHGRIGDTVGEVSDNDLTEEAGCVV